MANERPTSTMLQDPPKVNPAHHGETDDGATGKDTEKETVRPEGKEKVGAEKEKKHEPDKDSPRFSEVYGKMKGLEGQLESARQDVELMRGHNQRLQAAVDKVIAEKEHKDEPKPPNPVEDPEAYAKYWSDLREQDKKAYDFKLQQDLTAVRFNTQLEMQKELHEDYEALVRPVMRLIETDSKLKDEIYHSPNPPKAAYVHGKKLAADAGGGDKDKTQSDKDNAHSEAERKRAIDQGRVEGASRGSGEEEGGAELSSAEKRTAKLMGITEEQYTKQKAYF